MKGLFLSPASKRGLSVARRRELFAAESTRGAEAQKGLRPPESKTKWCPKRSLCSLEKGRSERCAKFVIAEIGKVDI